MALPDHFNKIGTQIIKENLIVDFNQGLDIRLVNDDNIKILQKLRMKIYRFAWDLDIDLRKEFKYVHENLGQANVYVLAGNISYAKLMDKLLYLKELKHRPYLMRLQKVQKNPLYIQLARWVNQQSMFSQKTFEEFLQIRNVSLNKLVREGTFNE